MSRSTRSSCRLQASTPPSHTHRPLRRLVLAIDLTLAAGQALAATSTWNCADGKWESAACWSPVGVPGSANDVAVPLFGGASTWLRFDATTGTRSANALSINSSTSTLVTLALSGGVLNLSSTMDVASTGTGRLQQSAGTLSGTMLRVGANAGSTGSATLSGGAINLSSWLVVGYGGQGSFSHSAGTMTASNIDIGAAAGSSGSYALSGTGAVVASSMWAAENGSSTFTQSGTSTVTATNLYMGGPLQPSGATSSYTLTGGTLNVSSALSVGYQGQGSASFEQSGGTVSGPTLFVGRSSTGSYTLGGGTLGTASYTMVGSTGDGSFTQTGGTHDTGQLALAGSLGSTGVYNLKGGTLNAASLYRGSGTAVFNWTGGTLNVGGTVTVTAAEFFGDTLNVGAGKTLTSATALAIGADGRLNQSGSAVISAPWLSNSGELVIEASTLVLGGTSASTNYGTMIFVGGALAGPSAAQSSALTNYGTITGNGTLGGGAFTNRGVLRASGGLLTLSTWAANANYGSIELASGTRLRALNTLANHGVVELSGGMLDSGAAGVITNESDGAIVGHGSLSGAFGANRGLVSVSGGMLSIGYAMVNAGQIILNGSGTGLIGGGAITNTGTLQGAGYVANAVANTGTIEAFDGTMTLASASSSNAAGGVISIGSGAKLLAPGGLAGGNAGLVQLDGGTFEAGGSALANSGRIVGHGMLRTKGLSNTGQLSLSFGDSQVSGAVANQLAGLVVVSNGSRATFADAVINAGELRISAGGAANFFGRVSGTGLFTGDGEARFEAGFSPGASPAIVTLNFEATFSANSPILMELGGATPGNCDTCADKIIFNRKLTLQGGPLDVVWWAGHAGQLGEVYDLFDFNGPLVGRFGQIHLPDLAPGLVWNTAHLYDSGELSVGAVPEPRDYALLLAGLAMLAWWVPRRRLGERR